jgi:protein-S-isoprenylcysteine O-methyltransferase Ste14
MSTATEAHSEKNAADNFLFGWTPKQVIVAIVLLLISTAVVLSYLAGVVRSTVIINTGMMSLLTGIGVLAGMVAAYHRRAGRWQLALIAYRVAFWCLFFAVAQVPQYTKQLEEFR